MNTVPECGTPSEFDENPHLIRNWCLRVAIETVNHASVMLRYAFHHSINDYRKELRYIEQVLFNFKKTLKESINIRELRIKALEKRLQFPIS
jgi:nitrate reductase assembly molybdenum cofactor insertion protein NarJ